MKLTELNVTLKTIQEQLEKAEKVKNTLGKLQDIVGLYDDDLINEVIRLKDLEGGMTENKPSGWSIKRVIEAVNEQLIIDGKWVQAEESYLDYDSYDDEVTVRIEQPTQLDLQYEVDAGDVEALLVLWDKEEKEEEAKKQEQEDKLRQEHQEDVEAQAKEESSDDE